MSLDDKYIAEQIEKDHEAVKAEIDYLAKAIHTFSATKDFNKTSFEFRRHLLKFKTLLTLHFELEEDIGFKHTMFIGNEEHIKTIQQFKVEHIQIINMLDEVIHLHQNLPANDELRLNILQKKLQALIDLIHEHERNETQLITDTIKEFKDAGRYTVEPTFKIEEIEKWAKDLNFKFPNSYIKAVTAGSYDKSTFHFDPPAEYPENNRFVVFGSWNDVLFGFDREYSLSANSPVYVLMEGMTPENKYEDFTTWFHLVFEFANQPTNAG